MQSLLTSDNCRCEAVARYIFNPLTTAIGRPIFGHKSPAARARELFETSTDLASLLLKIEKNNFRFCWEVF